MPLVEKVASEAELRAYMARLQLVIERNPATAKDQCGRLEAARRELNNLLLSQPGYEVVNIVDNQAKLKAAYDAGYAAGRDRQRMTQDTPPLV